MAEQGLPADVVEFSLEPDMNRLVDNEIVAADWNETPTDGNVTESVVVFMVRSGNPEGIETWDDLTADGIEVINPNPFTSGGARWNVMAAYASQIEQGATEEEAIQYLNDLYANVTVQDDSARKSLETFTGGAGDVLLGYENEAIFAQQNGADIDYVIPPQTILIENPVAVTETTEHAEQAQAFYDYLFTEEGQQIFADNGYRPVIDGVDPPEGFEFPTDIAIADIDDFGGWTEVMDTFFDTEDSIMKDVQEGIGVQVESPSTRRPRPLGPAGRTRRPAREGQRPPRATSAAEHRPRGGHDLAQRDRGHPPGRHHPVNPAVDGGSPSSGTPITNEQTLAWAICSSRWACPPSSPS